MLVSTITTQRSGSKLLGGCFLGGTVVSPFGEVFNPESSSAGSFKLFAAHDRPDYNKESGYDILRRYFNSLEEIRAIAHIDIMFNQLEIASVTWSPDPYFFIYSYLKWAQAVVIHLERDVEDTYLSARYLQQVGGGAHNFDNTSIKRAAGLTLDIDDYYRYRRFCLWHKCQLHDAMRDYPFFYHLRYEDLAENLLVPLGLQDIICAAAELHKVPVERKMFQVTKPLIYKSNIDYRAAFSNYHELEERSTILRETGM